MAERYRGLRGSLDSTLTAAGGRPLWALGAGAPGTLDYPHIDLDDSELGRLHAAVEESLERLR